MSGGVIKADSIKIATKECLRYFFKISAPNIPIFARIYIITGSSKNNPDKKSGSGYHRHVRTNCKVILNLIGQFISSEELNAERAY